MLPLRPPYESWPRERRGADSELALAFAARFASRDSFASLALVSTWVREGSLAHVVHFRFPRAASARRAAGALALAPTAFRIARGRAS